MKKLSTTVLLILLAGCGGGGGDKVETETPQTETPQTTRSENIYEFDVNMGGSLVWDDLCWEIPVELATSAAASVEIESMQLCRTSQISDYFMTLTKVAKKPDTGNGCFARLDGISFLDTAGQQLYSSEYNYISADMGNIYDEIITTSCLMEGEYGLLTSIFKIDSEEQGFSATEFKDLLTKIEIADFSMADHTTAVSEKTIPQNVNSASSTEVTFEMTNNTDLPALMTSKNVFFDDQGRFVDWSYGYLDNLDEGESVTDLVEAGDTRDFHTYTFVETKIASIMIIPELDQFGLTVSRSSGTLNNHEADYLENRAKQQALLLESQQ